MRIQRTPFLSSSCVPSPLPSLPFPSPLSPFLQPLLFLTFFSLPPFPSLIFSPLPPLLVPLFPSPFPPSPSPPPFPLLSPFLPFFLRHKPTSKPVKGSGTTPQGARLRRHNNGTLPFACLLARSFERCLCFFPCFFFLIFSFHFLFFWGGVYILFCVCLFFRLCYFGSCFVVLVSICFSYHLCPPLLFKECMWYIIYLLINSQLNL